MTKRVARLYHQFRPEHYDLYLKPDRKTASFSGKVSLTGQKTGRPNYRLTLHQKGLKVKRAKLIKIDKSHATEIAIDRINSHKNLNELRLHTKEQLYPGKYIVEIEFAGLITEPMHGIYPCNFEVKGQKKQLIATQFESHHAREAFPCIDEPEAKASFSLTLATPKDETVISNTSVKSQYEDGRKVITEFEKTPVMSSYLLAFAFGELGHKAAKTRSGIGVRVYATPDKVELTGFALDVAVRCLEFFEDYYQTPYPLPKLDLIGLPDFSAGAMENWGLITFREQALYIDPKNSAIETKQFVAMVICHEIAHQWFGNLVTMKWWNDLWLNESFANLMEYVAVDNLFPQWDIFQEFVQREVSSALARDSLPNVQSVQTEVNHPDELSSIFDPSIVYAKGGSLLNMVRHLVGEDKFRAGLKSYFTEHQYSNTEASDLWRHLKTASQIDIADFMQNWLSQPGYPVIEVVYKPPQTEFNVSQQRLVLAAKPPASSTVWKLPLATSYEVDASVLESKTGRFKIIKKGSYPLTLNHEGHSYFVTQYMNNDHLDDILKAVKSGVLSPTDRLLMVQNHLLLERAGKVTTLRNLQLLEAYQNERNEAVWGMLSGIIGNVRGLIDKDRELESRLNTFLRPIIAPLVKEVGWRGSKSEAAQAQKLRALVLSLAAVAEDPGVIKKGLQLFNEFKKPADLAPDVRTVVYFIAVRHGPDADFKKLQKLYSAVTNPDEKEEIAAELTSTRDAAKIKILLSMITNGDVRLQDAPSWFAWLLRNRYSSDLTWQWLIDNWWWIEDKYGSDKSYDRFPRYAGMVFSKPEQLVKYIAFFGPKQKIIALNLAIKLGVEEIESRVAWRRRNEQQIKNWLLDQNFNPAR